MVKVGTCLLGNCQKALAGCLTDVGCVKDLACLQSCNGRPDEIDCQVRAGAGGMIWVVWVGLGSPPSVPHVFAGSSSW